MIEEAYVSFEVAKLLKKKGFNEPCVWSYDPNSASFAKNFVEPKNSELNEYEYSKPTQQMAMAWLREAYGIYIVLFHTNKSGWWYNISDMTDSCVYYSSEKIKLSYEEAVEAAIKYCLENLI